MKRAEAERGCRRHPGHPKNLGRLPGRRPQDGGWSIRRGGQGTHLRRGRGGGLKEARSIVVDDLVQPGDSWMGIPTDSDVEAMAQQFLATIE